MKSLNFTSGIIYLRKLRHDWALKEYHKMLRRVNFPQRKEAFKYLQRATYVLSSNEGCEKKSNRISQFRT